MIALTGYGDTSSATGDYKLTGVYQRADGSDFNNFSRLWGSYYTAVAPSCVFLHNVAVFFFCNLSLLLGHKVPDWLGGSIKSRIICINTDLSDHGSHRNIIDIAVVKFFS